MNGQNVPCVRVQEREGEELMAITVKNCFEEFMRDYVNLDPEVTEDARSSRDNLLKNIAEFSGNDGFFYLCEEYNIQFGSFARKTKCRELDDIDLMIGIHAHGATYWSSDPWDSITITAGTDSSAQMECANEDGTLNSTKVVNQFKKRIENVRDYSRSEVKRSGEAVVLNLVSKEWSFDIVPCFHTVKESDGKSYYLIPNGSGKWKKTDPRIDRNEVQKINQRLDGKVLELIRLAKKWNKAKKARTIPSYLLETLVLNHCKTQFELSDYIDIRFREVLLYISDYITEPVYDPKGIQGDINSLSVEDRDTLSLRAKADYDKACEAIDLEIIGEQKKAIQKWKEILGGDFPDYR